jgi:hypothetical protein
MTQKVRAAGPPGYGGATEGTVGEQDVPDDNNPGYEGGPEGKSELGNPPGVLEKPIDTERTAEPEATTPVGMPVDQADVPTPIGVPVDQTE